MHRDETIYEPMASIQYGKACSYMDHNENELERSIHSTLVPHDDYTDEANSSVQDAVASMELNDDENNQGLDMDSSPATASITTPLVDKMIKFPTDPALFANRAVTPTLIEELLALGPCQPGLHEEIDCPRDNKGRAFRRQLYTPQLKYGIKNHTVTGLYTL